MDKEAAQTVDLHRLVRLLRQPPRQTHKGLGYHVSYVNAEDCLPLMRHAADRIEALEAGLRELRRWVGDGDLSESFGWSDEDYTPAYRKVLHDTDALLKPNVSGEARCENYE